MSEQPQSARPDYYIDADGRDVIDRYIEHCLRSGGHPSTVALQVEGFYRISAEKYRHRAGSKGDASGDADKAWECSRCASELGIRIGKGTVTAEWLRSNEWRRG